MTCRGQVRAAPRPARRRGIPSAVPKEAGHFGLLLLVRAFAESKCVRAAGLLYVKDTPPGFLSQYLPSRSVESSSICNDQVGQDGRCPIGAVAFFICRHSNCRPQFERSAASGTGITAHSASALCAVAVRICPAAPRQKKPAPFRFPGLRKSRESSTSAVSFFLSKTEVLTEEPPFWYVRAASLV